jgi:hypothetical protein
VKTFYFCIPTAMIKFCFQNWLWKVSERVCCRVARWFYFQTKNPNSGKSWRALDWILLIYFMAIWDSLWPFGIFCGHLGYLWPFDTFCVDLVGLFQFWYHAPRKIWQPWSAVTDYSWLSCLPTYLPTLSWERFEVLFQELLQIFYVSSLLFNEIPKVLQTVHTRETRLLELYYVHRSL